MSIYYVSNQNGNDGNDGSSPALAKKTIQAGINLLAVSAGDILYIGPGTYREKLDLAVNGSPSNLTKIKGDPDCLQLTADAKGVVRVSSTNELNYLSISGTSNRLFNTASYANYEIWNILFDGQGDGNISLTSSTPSSWGVYGNYFVSNRKNYFYNCCIENCSYGGAYQVYLNNCFISNGLYGSFDCIVENSVCIGGQAAVRGNTIADGITNKRSVVSNSIMISGNYTTLYTWVINSLSIGSYYGVNSSYSINSIYLGSYIGNTSRNALSALSDSAYSSVNNLISNCTYGFQNHFAPSLSSSTTAYNSGCYSTFVTTNDKNLYITSLTSGGTPIAITAAPIYRFDGFKAKEFIKKAFDPNPEQSGLSGVGNYSFSSSAGSYDTLNRTRILGTGSQIDIGPYSLSNIQEKYDAGYYNINPPGFYFTNIGEKIINIYASTGNLSISAWVKDTLGKAVDLSISGNNIYSLTASNKSGNWQAMSISASITGSDQIIKLILRNQTNSTTGLISDIRVY